jgi:hypothetical protein
MMGRGAKWSCLLGEMVQLGQASREPLVAALCMTLTKAPAIVNEAAEACVQINMSVLGNSGSQLRSRGYRKLQWPEAENLTASEVVQKFRPDRVRRLRWLWALRSYWTVSLICLNGTVIAVIAADRLTVDHIEPSVVTEQAALLALSDSLN